MSRSGKPVRIADGIYAHATHIRVVAKAGKRSRETRYPLGSDLKKMLQWQLRTKSDLIVEAPERPVSGTLIADAPRFLATLLAGSRKRQSYEYELGKWLATPLATRQRDTIRRADVLARLAHWEHEGFAISTRNHFLRALRMLYEVLDSGDDEAINPCAKIKRTREPEPEARGVEYALIDLILAELPERRYRHKLSYEQSTAIQTAARVKGANLSAIARTFDISETMVRKLVMRRTPLVKEPTLAKTRAHLMVHADTGLPPAQIMRLQPADIDVEARTVRVTPRRKGKGVKARVLPLSERAITSFTAFIAADAFGPYSTSSEAKSFSIAKQRLIEKVRQTLSQADYARLKTVLDRLRPYDLRHSFGTEILKRTNDIKAAKELLLHSDLRTTERYVEGAVQGIAKQAIAALDATLPERRSAGGHGVG